MFLYLPVEQSLRSAHLGAYRSFGIAAFECTAELNAELLQSAVSAVLVTRQMVRLQLKNGQIIGKDDLV